MRVAIVEDCKNDMQALSECILKYGNENSLEFTVDSFSNATDFLEFYMPAYDIVFMDIELSEMNGIDVAKKMRERDGKVILIFVTSHTKYAIKGYEVNALAYLLKPVTYQSLAMQLDRSVELLKKDDDKYLAIKIAYGMIKIPIRGLRYIEVFGHQLIFGTIFNDIKTRGNLSEYEEKLAPFGFCRCNRSVLVNKKYIEQVKGRCVIIGEKQFYLSRASKCKLSDLKTEG